MKKVFALPQSLTNQFFLIYLSLSENSIVVKLNTLKLVGSTKLCKF